jgi:aspartate kinase
LITVLGVPDVPGTIYQLFAPIAERKITVDMIVQNVAEDGQANISFTVPRDELADVIEVIEKTLETLGGRIGTTDQEVSKISAVGIGMARQTGVASRMFRALAEKQINLQLITTSEIKISVLVDRPSALEALRTVHAEFELEQINGRLRPPQADPPALASVSPTEVVEMLQGKGMEGLTIDDITMDDQQSRITLVKVANRPGIASTIFNRLSENGIFIDMIVQSYYSSQSADLSFSVLRNQFDFALRIARELCQELGFANVIDKQAIAKLSVSGIGLRSHTAVGIGMFRALAEAGINVEMINTSEVRVNVVVDAADGPRALECLKQEFSEI